MARARAPRVRGLQEAFRIQVFRAMSFSGLGLRSRVFRVESSTLA